MTSPLPSWMLVAAAAIGLLGFAVGPALRAIIRRSTLERSRAQLIQPIDLASAVLFAAVALRFSADTAASWVLPAYLFFAATGIVLTVVDARTRRLPNRIVLPSFLVALALLMAAAVGSGAWTALLRALGGAAVLFVAYLALALIVPKGLGFGDVKLAALVGLYLGWLGWGELVIGVVVTFWLGGLVSLALTVTRRIDRRSSVPFGPFMLSGAAVAVFLSGSLSSLVGLS